MLLCQDQSRCLPNKLICDGIIRCIGGSDEMEQCKYPKYFRYLQNNQMFTEDWLNFLYVKKHGKLNEVKDYEANTL